MADAKREPNLAPGGKQEPTKKPAEPGSKADPTQKPTSSEVMPNQVAGSDVNTPTVQRAVSPGTQAGSAAPASDKDATRVNPIQQSIPSGSQPAGGEAGRVQESIGSPTPTDHDDGGDPNPDAKNATHPDSPEDPGALGPRGRSTGPERSYPDAIRPYRGPTTRRNVADQSGDPNTTRRNRRGLADRPPELKGMEKLVAMVDSYPDDTPDEHVVFGYGGHKLTVGDLRLIADDA